jgi:hypothetical protein
MVSKHVHDAALRGILELDGGVASHRALRNFLRAVADEPVAPEAPAPAPPPPAPQPAKGGKKE